MKQDETKTNTLDFKKNKRKKQSPAEGTIKRTTHSHIQEIHKKAKLKAIIYIQWTFRIEKGKM